MRARRDCSTTTLGDDAAVVLLPLGSHGVLGFETTSEELDASSVDLARILAANIEVALDRAEREARLETQNERLEQFASIASHDLCNPMATAEGYLEAYRESGDPAHADEIEAALERMDRLTDDLLELARHGRIVEPIDLVAVVERAWGSVPTDDAVLDLGADLEGTTYGDAERVQEALENLFRNSMEHGHTSANVGVCVRLERLRNGIAVSDDGPGIPDSKKGEVFDLGYTDSIDGTGYGLYIVDQIVTAHDWSIRVTDTDADDGGARFEITGLEFDD
ncbi:sensor histidine kinase [Natronosalvus vescus]|uniref:sensor histidine kinase n=1 Tax=Natronosalvus vescus TaxID=2953881 RepID=UPI0020916B7A|nr:HAMP domain-containing sensor histidine kinase [Natronosalvus vescus]